MSQTFVGIDAGTHSFKLARCRRHPLGVECLDLIEEPVQQTARTPHSQQLQSFLLNHQESGLLNTDQIHVSLSSHLFSFRMLHLPRVKGQNIDQAAEFELEGLVPFEIDQVMMDHVVLGRSDQTQKIVSLYGLRDAVEPYLKVVTDILPQVAQIGCDAIDIVAAAGLAMVPQEGYYCVCDLGHSKSTVLIFKRNELCFVRTFGLGGYHMTRAIQRMYNLSFDKAEALKLSRGKVYIKENESDQVSRTIHRVAGEMASHIKQTLLMARRILPDLVSCPVFCTGGVARMVGMNDYLSYALRTNVFDFDFTKGLVLPESISSDACVPHAVSLGGAAQFMQYQRIPRVNLRKRDYAVRFQFAHFSQDMLPVIVMPLLFFLMLGLYYGANVYYYYAKSQVIERAVVKMAKDDFKDLKLPDTRQTRKKQSIEIVKKYLDAAKGFVDQFKTGAMASSQVDPLVLLTELSRVLPPKQDFEFEVGELNYSDAFLKLTATTTDTLNVEKIVAKVRESDLFHDIESTDAQKRPGGKYSFIIKLRVGAGEDAAQEETQT